MKKKKDYVQFGMYYRNDQFGLVRTICRIIDITSNVPSIAFVKVGDGGCASETFSMDEEEFKEIFIGLKGPLV